MENASTLALLGAPKRVCRTRNMNIKVGQSIQQFIP